MRSLEVIKGRFEVKIKFQHNLDMLYVFRTLGQSLELIYSNFKDLTPIRGHERSQEVIRGQK